MARRVLGSLELYLERIEKALYDDLGDRTFCRRLYFDRDHPLGDDDLHIEPQAFLLQAESLPVERKRRLWLEVQDRVLAGEKLGPRQRERTLAGATMAPYTSARHYPRYWTGLSSAADTVNAAAAGDIAGLPRPDDGGAWTTFASYCAHPHAWTIYAWSRIAEGRI